MPTEFELAAGARAARETLPGMGDYSGRVVAKAVLEAAERVRNAPPSLSDPCPHPDEPGWTMQQCFDAKRCGCSKGVALGYQPTTMPIDPQ